MRPARGRYVLEQQIEHVVGRRRWSERASPVRARRHEWGAGRVQSLLFAVDRWTPGRAVQWARRHGFRVDKVHVTDRYVRLRQSSPTLGWPKRIKRFGRPGHEEELGISAVVEFSPS